MNKKAKNRQNDNYQEETSVKKTFLAICSVLLIVASLFSFYAAAAGIKDGLDIKAYKEADALEADVVGELEKAIGQLKENEQTYLDGVRDFEQGQKDYEDGQKKIADGEKSLAAGYADYDAGLKAYTEGKAAYAAGLEEYAAGKALLDENTAAYEEGKALIDKIDPLMPLVNLYVSFRNGLLTRLPGFDDAQLWFVEKVKPMAGDLGLELPDDVVDLPGYVQAMVTDGKAQMKEYEDGLAQLQAAEKQLTDAEQQLKDAEYQLASGKQSLADGEAELAQGKIDLADGAKALEEGAAALKEFEDGMALVDEYTMTCYKNEPIYRYDGSMAVPGPEQRLGESFTWAKLDKNGEPVMINGHKYLDLDQCLVVCASFRDSVDEHVADVTRELYGRLGLYIAMILTGILSLAAGICGLVASGSRKSKGIKAASTLGTISAILMIVCNVFGLLTRYTGYTYPLRYNDAAGNEVFEYSGTLQLEALLVFLVVAIVFVFAAVAVKEKAAKAETV